MEKHLRYNFNKIQSMFIILSWAIQYETFCKIMFLLRHCLLQAKTKIDSMKMTLFIVWIYTQKHC